MTLTVTVCLPGASRIEATYREPRRLLWPLIVLPSSLQVTEEIAVPVTRAVKRAAAHAAGMPVSFAVAGAACSATLPTAVQTMLDVHDTAFKDAPGALGVRANDHLVPSQRCTSGRNTWSKAVAPMATQAWVEVHETPCRSVYAPGAFGAA